MGSQPCTCPWGMPPLSSSACSWFSPLFPGCTSVLSRTHRGEGVWAPSSIGSFLEVVAYAEAELGLGLGVPPGLLGSKVVMGGGLHSSDIC